ncbi:shikimate dehydrogenase [Jannaschia pohangensis]|uniref:Shikimate dehydrogenase (NADP(+)) n=1 Tax=Jannaschia pohangensis TaxID=390807 RepID=A0A1I3TDZ5_9RHOB|nr:shikimate dehydrogenase [Jannaschia pohangensis]SFJ69388.1 shikimate dehydrogenase [Jannaschia pohangensis]
MTILAGVIGDPIGHSRSPRLHGTWLRRHGIDGHYVPLHVLPDDLSRTLDLLPRLGFAGINVTIPHKEAVFDLAHDVTDRASAVGAANTLTFVEGEIHADNTDGYGFIANLRDGAPGWTADRPALVLGAGGAARGVIAALLDAGVPQVTLVNRTRGRADALADLFDDGVEVADWSDLPDTMASQGLLVNTTSLGMAGQPPLEIDLSGLPKTAIVTDIVYTPVDTPLLVQARAAGHPTVDGVGMLLHQAVPGFARWFGVTPTVDDDLRRAVLG